MAARHGLAWAVLIGLAPSSAALLWPSVPEGTVCDAGVAGVSTVCVGRDAEPAFVCDSNGEVVACRGSFRYVVWGFSPEGLPGYLSYQAIGFCNYCGSSSLGIAEEIPWLPGTPDGITLHAVHDFDEVARDHCFEYAIRLVLDARAGTGASSTPAIQGATVTSVEAPQFNQRASVWACP